MMIPKIIHYCWFGPNKMSKLHLACIDSWKKELPEFKIIRWNENNTPMDIPFIQYHYDKKNWAYISDFVRLHVLYHHGGIYLDTDVEVIKNFSPLLIHNVFVGYEKENRLNSAVLGAQKEEHYIKACMDYMLSRQQNKLPYRIAPEIISSVYNKQTYPEVLTLSEKSFYPYNPYNKNSVGQLLYHDITEETYAIHHWAKSWKMSLYERIMRKIV